MLSQTEKQIITIHIFPNILLRSKDNQAMKFSQLIEYSMRSILLEKSYTKCGGKAIPTTFYKKSKLSISRDLQSEMLYSLLLLYVQVEV